MQKMVVLLALCTHAGLLPVQAQMLEHTYDFNGLSIAPINGQDGWTSVNNVSPNPNSDCLDINAGYGSGLTSPDVSMYAFYCGGGPNIGRTATRVTTPALPFDFNIGGVMEIQVDIYAAWWGTFFGFGYDKNANGYIVKGLEQVAAYEANEGGIGLYLSKAPQCAALNSFMKPDGTKITFTYDSIYGKWSTYKMVIDFDANGGAGSLSLFARPTGGSFQAISQVQNINLGLTPGSGNKLDPDMWKNLYIHSTGSYTGFDNITIRQPNVPVGMQYQYITFPSIGDHLTTDAPFTLQAYTNKGLPVSYSIASGPATVNNDLLTLTGTPGVVTVVASQAGNDSIMTAANDTVSFNVINPLAVFPVMEVKSPVGNAAVLAPTLGKIPVSVVAGIDHSDILHISKIEISIDGGAAIEAIPTENDYYIAYWSPTSAGTHNLQVTTYSSGGPAVDTSFSFTVDQSNTQTRTQTLIDHLDFHTMPTEGTLNRLDTTIALPCFTGTYSKIMAYLSYECPAGGCEEWDVIATVQSRGSNGEFIEFMRYITPYGKACYDSLDITDLASQLQGHIDFIADFPAASMITIEVKYIEGTPAHKYSWVTPLWHKTYPFGKYVSSTTAEQAVEPKSLNLHDTYGIDVEAATLRIMASGHGWGSNNTANAAEFRESTHKIKINGVNTFDQHLWRTCNPNPTGCNNQSGTWQYDRHGWCPGTIPILWQFDLAPKVGQLVDVQYVFDTTYVDLCSSFNPACITGTTCPSCTDTYNPSIVVAGDLITWYDDAPYEVEEIRDPFELIVFPNPNPGTFTLLSSRNSGQNTQVSVLNLTGSIIKSFKWNGDKTEVDLRGTAPGVYVLRVSGEQGTEYQRVVIQ